MVIDSEFQISFHGIREVAVEIIDTMSSSSAEFPGVEEFAFRFSAVAAYGGVDVCGVVPEGVECGEGFVGVFVFG